MFSFNHHHSNPGVQATNSSFYNKENAVMMPLLPPEIRCILTLIGLSLIIVHSNAAVTDRCGPCSCKDDWIYCRSRSLINFPAIDDILLKVTTFISLRDNSITYINNATIHLLKARRVVIDARAQRGIPCVRIPHGIPNRIRVSNY